MPIGVGRRFDFQLGGKGFMLVRSSGQGRAWQRTGRSDAPSQRSQLDARYGAVEDQLDHPEVWDDWSGGFGNAYRKAEEPNTFHWSEGFDSRWPKQLVHFQDMEANFATLSLTGSPNAINAFLDVPSPVSGDTTRPGTGGVLILGDKVMITETLLSNVGISSPVPGVSNALMRWGFRPAVFGSYIYVPNLTGTSFEQYTFAAVGSPNIAGMPAAGFAVAGNRLWRFHGPGTKRIYLQSCAAGADPTLTANWSATLTIGNGQYDINDMIALEDQVFVGMPDGLYAGDQSGTFFNVITELAYQRHAETCRVLAPYQSGILVPHQGGLYYYNQDDFTARVQEVAPNLVSNRSPIRGRITALHTRGQWAYVGVWSGSASYLMAGRGTSPGGPFIWHPLERITDIDLVNRRISRIHMDGITTSSGGLNDLSNRLWLGMDGHATASYSYFSVVVLPAQDTNPLNADPTFSPRYIGSARIDLGIADWKSPSTPKVFRDVEVWSDKLASGALWCQLFYDIDQSGSFTLLGTVAKSPKDTLYFPSGEGSFTIGQSIELSLRSFTATRALTPIYRAVVLRGALQPRSIDTISAVARIADGLRDRQGDQMRAGATMLQELRDFANPDVNGGPHQLIDLAGATQWAKVLPPIEEHEVYQQGEEYPEVAATVRMAVLTYS